MTNDRLCDQNPDDGSKINDKGTKKYSLKK